MREKIVYFCGFCGHEQDEPADGCTKCSSKVPLRMWKKQIHENKQKRETAA